MAWGAGNNAMTNEVLWPTFEAVWPLLSTPAGETTQAMGWQGLPLINTLILLTSSVTLHFAHVAMENNKRTPLKVFLGATVLLGVCFLGLQVEEYIHAYNDLNLTLDAGVYGNTFILLTGFHGMHVTLGTVLLLVILLRILKGHFTKDKHFAFQAACLVLALCRCGVVVFICICICGCSGHRRVIRFNKPKLKCCNHNN